MKRTDKFNVVIALMMILSVLFSLPVSANSAESPNLTVLVNFAPEDVDVNLLVIDKGEHNSYKSKSKFKISWETTFKFYTMDEPLSDAILVVSSS